ncbi:unnamed protein product [Hydatigera taeniaeformis]|uniref:porphobilinogen synthase n=1 Tax=Hydatigena taeniaeformis TaxID=6205 RepID=A0A0R3X904_HYDTA|nr:unnamed protein product [Hydatigera taeniaeformis]
MNNYSLHSGYNTPLLRYWQSASCTLTGDNLIYPIFISSNDDSKDDIPGLPNQVLLGLNNLVEHLRPLVEKQLKCVLIFGVVDDSVKDDRGSAADYGKSPVIGALKLLRAQLPSLILACDVVDVFVFLGAHIIAPSDMSEGRILAIKQLLHKNGFSRQVSVMSYAAKFASSFYGPFR